MLSKNTSMHANILVAGIQRRGRYTEITSSFEPFLGCCTPLCGIFMTKHLVYRCSLTF